MSFMQRMGKLAMDALDSAGKVAGEVHKRVDPLVERSPLASRLRDRLLAREDEPEVDVPHPNKAAPKSPFVAAEVAPPVVLGKPSLPAQVFGEGTSPWTGRALQRLTDRGVEHEFVDLESDDGVRYQTALTRETKQNSGPYLYLRGEFIGGFNALDEIDRLGQLDELIKPPEQRDPRRARVVIARRDTEDVFPGAAGNPDDRK